MKKILLSVVTIGVVGAIAAGATSAYFSDTETSTGNTFTAGTLDLKLANNDDTTFANGTIGTWVSPTNWAPGESLTSTIHMTNVGSVDSHHVYFGFYNPTHTGSVNLMDKIIITSVVERFNSHTTANQAAALAGQIGDHVAPLTLAEMVNFMPNGYGFYSWDDQSGDNVILAGGDQKDYDITFAMQFDPNAGNEYQGLTAGFNFNMNATQNSPTEGMISIH